MLIINQFGKWIICLQVLKYAFLQAFVKHLIVGSFTCKWSIPTPLYFLHGGMSCPLCVEMHVELGGTHHGISARNGALVHATVHRLLHCFLETEANLQS